MSKRIDKHARAKGDLADLAEFIRRESPKSALRFLEAAEKAFEFLADMPEIGGLEEDVRAELVGLRCWPIRGFENHLIFYLPIENGIAVVRVLHAARDINSILGR